jgi:FkbM family methyltransferase
MTSEIELDPSQLADALAAAGSSDRLREELFDCLRRAEADFPDPAAFREEVRWPIVLSMLQSVEGHQVVLGNGLVLEIGPDSRIEKGVLLSLDPHPEHLWEPQTTKLLLALAGARPASNVVVGGAYIGDQAIPLASALRATGGTVHAFEPMALPFHRLQRNVKLNELDNVVALRLALWDRSEVPVEVVGHVALGSPMSLEGREPEGGEVVRSVTIADYARQNDLSSLELITLDTEGGEERALLGALELLEKPLGEAPDVVFEVHRSYVDWSPGLENTAVVRLFLDRGYTVFAVRDFHSTHGMANEPVELVPVATVYVDGPPHGFNMLATKNPRLVDELGLQVVEGVSPKLLLHKDPRLHHPTGWLR